MSKKTLLIISVIFLILIGGLFGTAYFIAYDTGETPSEVLRDFLPFGGEVSDLPPLYTNGSDTEGGATGENVGGGDVSIVATLTQLTREPVSGATLLGAGASTTVRYMERATGHVYDINLESGERKRITNTTLLTVEEVVWDETGNRLILRYLDEEGVVKTFAGTVANEGQGPGKIFGTFMPDNILSVVASPDGREIFYLSRLGSRSVGTRASFDNKNLRNIFNFPFTEWLSSWASSGTLLLTTKPAENITGVAYALSAQNGTLAKIVDGRGLISKLSSDGNLLLYTTHQSGAFQSFVYNRKTSTAQTIPFPAIPEKCVWGEVDVTVLYCAVPEVLPVGFSLGAWYEGGVSFSDEVWRIETDGIATTFLISPQKNARTSIDVVDPILSKDEVYLIFKNKKDNSLWLLKNNPN